MGALLAQLIRKIAEGDFDFGKVKLSAVYWRLAGVKTWSGLVLGIAYFGMTEASAAGLCPDCSTWAGYVGAASAFMLSIGLVDAGVRARAPFPPDWKE